MCWQNLGIQSSVEIVKREKEFPNKKETFPKQTKKKEFDIEKV